MKNQSKLIPFHLPHVTANEVAYVTEAMRSGLVSGDGKFTKSCHELLKKKTGATGVLLTHSCTAALEMAALLCDLQPGDEVIMPSYTFVSTANAFVLRRAVPVFIDVRPDTFNIDETKIEQAITPKTKAICAVHYAGVGCEMDTILKIAHKHGLKVIEDAAQGVNAFYKGRALGTIGDFGTYSFHQSKNITSGEGGVLLIRDEKYVHRAEIIREKGTDRSQFLRGEVDKYCWRDVGSSYLPSDIIGAYLLAQLEESDKVTAIRQDIWNLYQNRFKKIAAQQIVQAPYIPPSCQHNAHIYFLVLQTPELANNFIDYLKSHRIHPLRHYVPLHSSPAGLRYGRAVGSMTVTDRAAQCLVRLPLWTGLLDKAGDIADITARYLEKQGNVWKKTS